MMKTLILSLIMATGLVASAQQATKRTSEHQNRTILTQEQIDKLPFSLPYNQNCDCVNGMQKWEGVFGGVGLGLTSAISAPEAYGFEMGKSIQITWPIIAGVRYNPGKNTSITVGIGVGWRNIKSTLRYPLIENPQGGVGLGTEADPTLLNSRIKIFSLQFPIILRQQLPLKFGKWKSAISVGPILNWNSHASIKNCYRDAEGNKYQTYDNLIYQRKFTIDAYLALHVGSIDIYGQFSPMKILEGHASPDLQPLSIGIGFGMP